MKTLFAVVVAASLVLVACSKETLFLPDGDAGAGKAVFTQYQCYGCHEVKGDSFPAPTAITPTFVAIGAIGAPKTRTYFVESIIAPSHQFAIPQAPAGQSTGDNNIKMGSRSKMTDFSDQLTVRQLFDLVAYMEKLQKQ